jgi:hypothetical protein
MTTELIKNRIVHSKAASSAAATTLKADDPRVISLREKVREKVQKRVQEQSAGNTPVVPVSSDNTAISDSTPIKKAVKKTVKKAVKKTTKKADGKSTENSYPKGSLGKAADIFKPKVKEDDSDDKGGRKRGRKIRQGAAKHDSPEFQRGVAVGDHDMYPVGIAFPSFCWEMFTGQSVLALSSIYSLGGAAGGYKSHLAAEFSRWVLSAGGIAALMENEGKYIEDLYPAVCGWDAARNVEVRCCSSFEHVQENMNDTLKAMDAQQKVRSQPFIQIIDSISGNASEEEQAKLSEDGALGRGYPVTALMAARFLASYTPHLKSVPYITVAIAHSRERKEGEGQYSRTVYELKGGAEWMFRCRLAMIAERVNDKPVHRSNLIEMSIRLHLLKDSADRGRKLPFKIYQTYDIRKDTETDTEVSARRVHFAWDLASVELLLNPESAGYPADWKTIAAKVLGLSKIKVGNRNYYIAKKLGINESNVKEKGNPRAVMNALYTEYPTVLNQLRAQFGIQQGVCFKQGDNYNDLRNKAKILAQKRAELYKQNSEAVVIREALLEG